MRHSILTPIPELEEAALLLDAEHECREHCNLFGEKQGKRKYWTFIFIARLGNRAAADIYLVWCELKYHSLGHLPWPTWENRKAPVPTKGAKRD